MLTLGHGRLDREELGSLLTTAGVRRLIDVRRFPGSRSNPAAARGQIPALLDDLGIGYRWDERLGGRRSLSADELRDSPDDWWQVPAFQAYAGWTRSPEFRAALPQLIAEASSDQDSDRTAILCSEAVWWRCHRRIISDVLTAEAGVPVEHLMHDGRLTPHRLSAGARPDRDGRLIWDLVGERSQD